MGASRNRETGSCWNGLEQMSLGVDVKGIRVE